MRHTHWITMVGAALIGAGTAAAADGWIELFNGKDLAGWTQKGGKAKYSVEDGAIVGSSVMDTPNSFLCTEKNYGDFILEYEFKVDPRLNSGVQIRSNCYDEEREFEWQGKTKKVPAGRVHGYQVEIDPDVKRARMWSAGIYDEGRRGWLCPGALAGERQGVLEAGHGVLSTRRTGTTCASRRSASIRTWLNGTPRASLIDDLTPSGFIGLQVHGIGKNKDSRGLAGRWRNLRITEIKPAAATTRERRGDRRRLVSAVGRRDDRRLARAPSSTSFPRGLGDQGRRAHGASRAAAASRSRAATS